MAAADFTSFDAYLVEYFLERPDRMSQMVRGKHKLLNMMRTVEDLGVENRLPLDLATPTGIANDIATAMAQRTASTAVQFSISGVETFMPVSFKRRDMERTRKDKHAIKRIVDHEMDGGMARLRNYLSKDVFGNAGGALGTVGAYTATESTFTFGNIIDATKVEKGDEIVVSENDGTAAGHSLRASGASATITKRNANTGVMTSDSAWDTQITGFEATDFVFIKSTFKNGRTGFKGWLPATEPTSGDSFHGVDRSATDVQRAAGSRVDGTGLAPENAFQDLQVEISKFGEDRGLVAVCGTNKYKQIIRSLDTKRIVELKKEDGTVGLRGVEFLPDIPLIFDNHCDEDKGYLLNMDDWSIRCTGKMISNIPNDGGGIMHYMGINGASNEDSYAVMMVSDCNIACRAPGRSGVVHSLGS